MSGCGGFAAVAYAKFGQNVGDVNASSALAYSECPSDLAVGSPVEEEVKNFDFSCRQAGCSSTRWQEVGGWSVVGAEWDPSVPSGGLDGLDQWRRPETVGERPCGLQGSCRGRASVLSELAVGEP